MEWAHILTLIGVNVAIFAGFATLLVWVLNKLDTDIKAVGTQVDNLSKRLDARLDAQNARTDQLYQMFVVEMKAQASRTDQLYQMFVDLLKEKKS